MILTILQSEHFHMMDWWFDLFGPLSWVIMLSGWIIYIVISVTIAYFVHRDAVRRSIKNSEFWLVMGLIFNLIGLIIYLLVRDNYREDA